MSSFREKFKYYKKKNPEPQFTDVMNFNYANIDQKNVIERAAKCTLSFETLISLGLKKTDDWKIYELLQKPGLLFIRNPFTTAGQQLWIKRCIADYTKKPNRLNIDIHGVLKNTEDWWDVCCRDGARRPALLKQLRWSTLGYHHDWDTKKYSEENRSEFPPDLAELSRAIVRAVLGLENYTAEAAIVNFYYMNSTLSGHVDCSETNLDAPLLSISFGQSAIFLIGGPSLEEEPTAIFLHSGDIVIMSSESRLCYHGVPRIVLTDNLAWETPKDDSMNSKKTPKKSEQNNVENSKSNLGIDHNDETLKLEEKCYQNSNFISQGSWIPYSNFIKTARINVNVRQVL